MEGIKQASCHPLLYRKVLAAGFGSARRRQASGQNFNGFPQQLLLRRGQIRADGNELEKLLGPEGSQAKLGESSD